jgi:hypothetical protein
MPCLYVKQLIQEGGILNIDDLEETEDAKIRKGITKHSTKGELPCRQAFAAAAALGESPAVIGRYADEMGIKLVACQLGLFGYWPEKKIAKAVSPVRPDLEAEIKNNLSDGRLSCKKAFDIADRMGLKKMDVSSACEALKISIRPCQLGAF